MMARLFHTIAFRIPLMTAVLVGLPAQAQTASTSPTAIIEDIDAEGVDFEHLDLVYEGDIIELGASGTLTLAYLRSCIVEEIEGGTVTVGRTRSKLANPRYPPLRQEVRCDGGGIVPTEEQEDATAVFGWRGYEFGDESLVVVVHAAMPVFAFIEPSKELIIDRVDPGKKNKKEKYRFIVKGARLDLADHWLDSAGQRVRLVAGGHYRATSGTSSVLFLISRDATLTSDSVISRLVGVGF